MFVARAGINTRRYEGQSGLTALLAPKKKSGEDRRFYCWVPCMLGPFIGGLVGLVILLGGAAMCTTGYYAKHFSSSLVFNGSHIVTQVDRSKEFHMYNMTFVGPVIMGCGCFVIIIACVVVCEQRDKDIRIKAEEEKLQGNKKNSKKKEFYNAVVNRLKKSQVYNNSFIAKLDRERAQKEQQPKKLKSLKKKKFKLISCMDVGGGEGSVRTQGQYSHIGNALKSIPLEIFSVDIEQRQGSTLLPIRVKSELCLDKSETADKNKCMLHKCPSASCIHDLVKLDDRTYQDNKHLFWQKLLKRSTSDLYIDQSASSLDESSNDTFTEPDSPMLECSNDTDISEEKHSTVQDSVVININDSSSSTTGLSTCKHGIASSSHSLFACDNQSDHPESQVIQCQAFVHPEQQQTKQGIIGNQANLNIAQGQQRITPDGRPDDCDVDTQVLAITSGIARANAAGMDLFKNNPARPKSKPGKTKLDHEDMEAATSQDVAEHSHDKTNGSICHHSIKSMEVFEEGTDSGKLDMTIHGHSEVTYIDNKGEQESGFNKAVRIDATDTATLSLLTQTVQDIQGKCELSGKVIKQDQHLDSAGNTVNSSNIKAYPKASDGLLTMKLPSANDQSNCDMEKSLSKVGGLGNTTDSLSQKDTEKSDNDEKSGGDSECIRSTRLRLENRDTLQTESYMQDKKTGEHNQAKSCDKEDSVTEQIHIGEDCNVDYSKINPLQSNTTQDSGSRLASGIQETMDSNKIQVKLLKSGSTGSLGKRQCPLEEEDLMACIDI